MAKAKPKTLNDYLAMSVCGNCRHFRRLDDVDQLPAEDTLGKCFRYPPTVFGIDENDAVIQGLAIVEAQHCCGDHAPIIN